MRARARVRVRVRLKDKGNDKGVTETVRVSRKNAIDRRPRSDPKLTAPLHQK